MTSTPAVCDAVEYVQFAVVVDVLLRRLVNRIIHFHNGRLISTTVTIVGSREDRHHTAIMLPLVALHDELVGSRNKVETVDVRELFGDVLAKRVAGAPW